MALSMKEFYDKNKNVENVKNVSDGWHTFQDLYDHRKALTAMVVSLIPNHCWKSKQHDDQMNQCSMECLLWELIFRLERLHTIMI